MASARDAPSPIVSVIVKVLTVGAAPDRPETTPEVSGRQPVKTTAARRTAPTAWSSLDEVCLKDTIHLHVRVPASAPTPGHASRRLADPPAKP